MKKICRIVKGKKKRRQGGAWGKEGRKSTLEKTGLNKRRGGGGRNAEKKEAAEGGKTAATDRKRLNAQSKEKALAANLPHQIEKKRRPHEGKGGKKMNPPSVAHTNFVRGLLEDTKHATGKAAGLGGEKARH